MISDTPCCCLPVGLQGIAAQAMFKQPESLQEVVSLGVRGSLNSARLQQSAAPHASPRHFHEMLAKAEEDSDMGTLLLDVRNHYETRIGSFQAVRLCRFIP